MKNVEKKLIYIAVPHGALERSYKREMGLDYVDESAAVTSSEYFVNVLGYIIGGKVHRVNTTSIRREHPGGL